MSRRNDAFNSGPRSSSLAGWSHQAGTGEVTTVAWVGTVGDGPEGRTGFVRRTVTTAKTGGTSGSFYRSAVGECIGTAGERRTLSLWVRFRQAVTVQLSGQLRTGATTSTTGVGSLTSVPAGVWTRLSVTLTAAVAYDGFQAWAVVSGGTIPVGGVYETADVLPDLGTALRPYFDATFSSAPDWTYSWAGAVYASASLENPTPGLRVEGFTDAPVPRVGITLTGLDSAGPSRVTLFRSTPGGQRRVVRGWNRRQVYGSDYAIDYEAPLGRAVTYSLEVNTGPIVPLRVSDATVLDADMGFIQDPLLPLSAVAVSGLRGETTTVVAPALRALTYAVETQTVAILGAREPVALTGTRLAASGIDFSMVTHAAEEGTALRELLLAGLVLVRPLPQWGDLPDLIYTVPQVSEQQMDTSTGGSWIRWSITGDQVRPPSIDVLVALWTYDQVAALWSTYAQAQSAATAVASRYLDVQRDPTMGV